jgi:hypothetical protein
VVGAASDGTYVYAAGGYNAGVINQFARYNPLTNAWTLLTPTVLGRLYTTNQTWGYDPAANSWNTGRTGIPAPLGWPQRAEWALVRGPGRPFAPHTDYQWINAVRWANSIRFRNERIRHSVSKKA